MWAQTWRTVAKFSYPFPNKTVIDVTDEMVAQVSFYSNARHTVNLNKPKRVIHRKTSLR